MSDPSEEEESIQQLKAQLQDLQTQVSLLRRTNACLCHENDNLKRGRDALITRLTLLEDALKAYQERAGQLDNCAEQSTSWLDPILPDSDRWLLKTSGADYAQLKDLLAQPDWEAADRETQRLMLAIAGPEAQTLGFLNAQHIAEFPCLDLKIINKLWTIFSSGKYSFMVQRDIWDRTKSTRNLWVTPEFDGYYPRREGLGQSLATRLLRCALDDF
jgi:FtsZ-binding cell division protein ZapB